MQFLTIKQLTKLIIEGAADHNPHCLEVDGIPLTYNMHGFPYWYKQHDPAYREMEIPKIVGHIFDEEGQAKYWAMHKVLTEMMQAYWYPVLAMAYLRRREAGLSEALPPFEICRRLSVNHPLALPHCIKMGYVSEDGELQVDEQDSGQVYKLIDLFLSLDELRKLFLEAAVTQVPYGSAVDYEILEYVPELFEAMQKGTIIDIGTGTGDNLLKIARRTKAMVIGYDMQFLPRTFSNWMNHNLANLTFAQIDSDKLPQANDSADVALMMSVGGHWGEPQLEKILDEAHRVLKVGGLIAISPFEVVHMYSYQMPHPAEGVKVFKKSLDGFEQVW